MTCVMCIPLQRYLGRTSRTTKLEEWSDGDRACREGQGEPIGTCHLDGWIAESQSFFTVQLKVSKDQKGFRFKRKRTINYPGSNWLFFFCLLLWVRHYHLYLEKTAGLWHPQLGGICSKQRNGPLGREAVQSAYKHSLTDPSLHYCRFFLCVVSFGE